MLSIDTLSALCSVLQIVGFILIAFWKDLPNFTEAFVSVVGFAAIVKVFHPIAANQDALGMVAAVAGFLLIFIGALMTQTK